MNILKGYKGVAIFYLVITLFSVLFLVNFEKPSDVSKASKDKNVVLNA